MSQSGPRAIAVRAFLVLVAGGVVGFILLWCIGVVRMYLTGGGYADRVAGAWQPRFGTFVGLGYGAPVGALAAVSGYLAFLRRVPLRELTAMSVPLLGVTTVGALPGLHSPMLALVAVPVFLAACARLGRRAQGRDTGQAAG